MICVEREAIPERMKFNKPYRFIQLEMKFVRDIIPTLKKERPYFVWLDYDSGLTPEILEDIDGFIQSLANGSVLLISV